MISTSPEPVQTNGVMTREEFRQLPYLLPLGKVVACGYSRATIHKYAAHGILAVVQPRGFSDKRFQKVQVARLLGWEELLDTRAWLREKPLLNLAAVMQWTGISKDALGRIAAVGGITCVNPAGLGENKYRKDDIGEWIGIKTI